MYMTIKDIIRVAKKLLAHPGMIVPREDLVNDPNLTIPFDTLAEKCLDGLSPTLRAKLKVADVSRLTTIVQKTSGRPLDILEPQVKEVALYGQMESYENNDFVQFKSGLTLCWARFTVAKELFHVYTNTAECSEATLPHIFADAKHARATILDENSLLPDEQAAFYFAIEFLLPFKLRDELYFPLTDFYGKECHYPVAKAFMCPQAIIAKIREDDYLALSHRINREVENEK